MIKNLQYILPVDSDSDIENYQNILDNATLLIILNSQKNIEYVNRKFCDVSGFDKQDVVGKHFKWLCAEDHCKDTFFQTLWKHLDALKIWKGEIMQKTSGESVFWQEVAIYPFSKDGREIYQYVVIGTDITPFRKALKVKNQFQANMSHELRTPLHTIYSLGNLLAETKLSEDQNDYMHNILNATSVLMRMLDDMLDMNKIETGEIKFENKIFNPKNIIDKIEKQYIEKSKEKSIEFFIDYDPKLPEFIAGDPLRLKQIMDHLLDNAFKYTPKGNVKMSCKFQEKQEHHIVFKFTVEDTGIGISADNLDLIQEKFQQANMKDTRTYGGSGLGLTIVKKLIELQNGTFEISSSERIGTRVVFTIPFKITSKSAGDQKSDVSSIGTADIKGMRVLIAEDVDINQMVIKKHMQKFGFIADFADNGKIAVDKLRKNKYDIVLMDMQMPVMDGYQAIKVIRNELPEPINSIPIISITASVMGEAPKKCLEVGANDYVPKPYNVADLKTKMEKWFYQNNADFQNNQQVDNMDNNQKDNKGKKYIDLNYLEQLSEGDDDFSISMLSYFIDNTPVVLNDLKEYYRQSEWKSLRGVAHKFKPQLTFMGIKSIFNDVENIEQYANDVVNTDEIPGLIDKVEKVCQKATKEIQEELEKLLDKDQ